MNPLSRLRRAIAARIPGSVANVAERKCKAEKELRAVGYSRDHAAAVVAERFRNRGPR